MQYYDASSEEKIKKFEEENSELLQNNLVRSFLNIPYNNQVYRETIVNPTPQNKQKLDKLFKHFYFKIRFISHISTTLKFNSINFDKKIRLLQSRFSTTLDAPINSSEEEESFVDLMTDDTSFDELNDVLLKADITDHVSCSVLYAALNSLTKKQKQIINLAYVEGLSDTEIATLLNKSQQAVSKTHKIALKSISNYIEQQK